MSNIGNKEILAKNLSYYVERSGKTQKDISAELGFSRTVFNEWLKGKKYPRIDKIELLANYFGILKSDLIEEKSEEHRGMQENNDTLVRIIVRMRADSEFLAAVKSMYELDAEKFKVLSKLLTTFSE